MKTALVAVCSRPVAKIVSRKTLMPQPKEFTKRQLYAMLGEAVKNTTNGDTRGVPPHPRLVRTLR